MSPNGDPEPLASADEPRSQHRALRPESYVPSAVAGAFSLTPRLDRLALTDEYLQLMQPALASLGATHKAERLETILGGERATFEFTLVIKATKRALLYIRDEVLTVTNRGNILALGEVRELLAREYDSFYVFHDSPPNPVYQNIMEGEWSATYHLRVAFVALSALRAFAQMALEEQAKYLTRVLDLDRAATSSAPGPKPRAQDALPIAQIKALSKKLAGLALFEDVRGRRVLLGNAGLADVAEQIDLQGAALTVAFNLITHILERGLGQLLECIRAMPDLPADDGKMISRLLESYAFD